MKAVTPLGAFRVLFNAWFLRDSRHARCSLCLLWLLCLGTGISLTASPVAAADPPTLPTSYDVSNIDPAELERAVVDGTPLKLDLLGRTLQIDLERSNLRGDNYQVTFCDPTQTAFELFDASFLYKGTVIGEEDSLVRLSLIGDRVRGYVRTDDEWIYLKPDPETAEASGLHVVYAANAIDPAFHGYCDSLVAEAVVDEIAADITAESEPAFVPTIEEGTGLQVLELAIDCDFEYFQIHGAGSAAAVEAVINEVDGIYQAELGLTIDIVHINVWNVSSDPYTTSDSSLLLSEFRNHWNANFGGVSRDLAHLFTGRDLDGSTIGIAYTTVTCHSTFGFGLSQELGSSALMPILVAHEIGHNLGSGHDSTGGSGPRYIMYPSLSGANLDEFSDSSTSQIDAHVAAVSCLSAASTSPPSTPPSGGGSSGGGPVEPLLVVLVATLWLLRQRMRQAPRR